MRKEGLEREGGERLETIEKAIKSTAEVLKVIKEDWNQEIKPLKVTVKKKFFLFTCLILYS